MYFERVELHGKRGRKVAVLLSPEMTKSLNLMIMKREECGVPNKNEYLFAVPHCITYYRGHQCLRKFADECDAKKTRFFTIYSAAERNGNNFSNVEFKKQ